MEDTSDGVLQTRPGIIEMDDSIAGLGLIMKSESTWKDRAIALDGAIFHRLSHLLLPSSSIPPSRPLNLTGFANQRRKNRWSARGAP